MKTGLVAGIKIGLGIGIGIMAVKKAKRAYNRYRQKLDVNELCSDVEKAMNEEDLVEENPNEEDLVEDDPVEFVMD